MTRLVIPARFWRHVDRTEGCWVWMGSRSPDGYGRFGGYREFGTSLPHRIAWQTENGPVPAGLELDHLCGVRACVRPSHLEPVTHEENVRRAWERRTHCRNGHQLTAETRVSDYMGGHRCLLCRRLANAASARRRRARAKAAA